MSAMSAQPLPVGEGGEAALFTADVLAGLTGLPKQIPCKYLYDERGSELFEEITGLEEYYPTRTEMGIMGGAVGEIAEAVGDHALLIEFGSGSSRKTRLLLDRLSGLAGYMPVDIARGQLERAAQELRGSYPELWVTPVCADYTRVLTLPRLAVAVERRVCFFPGSTIGNFTPTEAARFLRQVARMLGRRGVLLIGVDLKKDPAMLTRAYHDAQGVTAAFNLNVLARVNREAGGNFDLEQFAHHAFYDPKAGRVEMHLVSRGRQQARVAGREIEFTEGETIWTESSYKYTVEEFRRLAAGAGFGVKRVWVDEGELFSVMLLEVGEGVARGIGRIHRER